MSQPPISVRDRVKRLNERAAAAQDNGTRIGSITGPLLRKATNDATPKADQIGSSSSYQQTDSTQAPQAAGPAAFARRGDPYRRDGPTQLYRPDHIDYTLPTLDPGRAAISSDSRSQGSAAQSQMPSSGEAEPRLTNSGGLDTNAPYRESFGRRKTTMFAHPATHGHELPAPVRPPILLSLAKPYRPGTHPPHLEHEPSAQFWSDKPCPHHDHGSGKPVMEELSEGNVFGLSDVSAATKTKDLQAVVVSPTVAPTDQSELAPVQLEQQESIMQPIVNNNADIQDQASASAVSRGMSLQVPTDVPEGPTQVKVTVAERSGSDDSSEVSVVVSNTPILMPVATPPENARLEPASTNGQPNRQSFEDTKSTPNENGTHQRLAPEHTPVRQSPFLRSNSRGEQVHVPLSRWNASRSSQGVGSAVPPQDRTTTTKVTVNALPGEPTGKGSGPVQQIPLDCLSTNEPELADLETGIVGKQEPSPVAAGALPYEAGPSVSVNDVPQIEDDRFIHENEDKSHIKPSSPFAQFGDICGLPAFMSSGRLLLLPSDESDATLMPHSYQLPSEARSLSTSLLLQRQCKDEYRGGGAVTMPLPLNDHSTPNMQFGMIPEGPVFDSNGRPNSLQPHPCERALSIEPVDQPLQMQPAQSDHTTESAASNVPTKSIETKNAESPGPDMIRVELREQQLMEGETCQIVVNSAAAQIEVDISLQHLPKAEQEQHDTLDSPSMATSVPSDPPAHGEQPVKPDELPSQPLQLSKALDYFLPVTSATEKDQEPIEQDVGPMQQSRRDAKEESERRVSFASSSVDIRIQPANIGVTSTDASTSDNGPTHTSDTYQPVAIGESITVEKGQLSAGTDQAIPQNTEDAAALRQELLDHANDMQHAMMRHNEAMAQIVNNISKGLSASDTDVIAYKDLNAELMKILERFARKYWSLNLGQSVVFPDTAGDKAQTTRAKSFLGDRPTMPGPLKPIVRPKMPVRGVSAVDRWRCARWEWPKSRVELDQQEGIILRQPEACEQIFRNCEVIIRPLQHAPSRSGRSSGSETVHEILGHYHRVDTADDSLIGT